MPGLRLISNSIPRLAGKTFSRKHVKIGRLLTHWEDIVGPEMATRCQPVKLRYRKVPGRQGQKGVSGAGPGKASAECYLTIAIRSTDAPYFSFQKQIILEKINHLFGAGWITRIDLEHTASDLLAADRPFSAAGPRSTKNPGQQTIPLTTGEKKSLSGILETISDPELRARLEEYGRAVMSEPPQEAGREEEEK